MKTPRPEPAVRPPRFLTDPRFGLALLLVLIVPFLVPIPMELRRHPIIGPLGNQVHVVLMGVFTLLFYWWGPLRGRLLGSALATAGLGVAIEIVQMPLGRSAAVFDVVLDLVGVAIICGWVIWRGHGRRAGLVLAVQLPRPAEHTLHRGPVEFHPRQRIPPPTSWSIAACLPRLG